MQIKVFVRAGSKNDRIKSVDGGYEISVRAKATGGMANANVLALLSGELGVPAKKLRIIRGLRSNSKTIEVL
jgi:uncharacterized protein YggU (UPF0235/DUF167 family)